MMAPASDPSRTSHRTCSLSLLFSPLSAAARTQAIDEPSDHEHGQQKRDDDADADEHIRDNKNGAVLDGHAVRSRADCASSVHHLLAPKHKILSGCPRAQKMPNAQKLAYRPAQ